MLLFDVIPELDLRLKSGKLQRRLLGNRVVTVVDSISVKEEGGEEEQRVTTDYC